MPERFSKKQQALLEYLDKFIKEHGYGPSYREVMSALGYKSVSTVAVHVDGLVAKGYIRKRDRSARSLEIITRHQPAEGTSDASAQAKAWFRAEIAKRGDNEEESDILQKAADILGIEQP